MGRPRKNEGALMNVPLRIMLTAGQKRLIAEAATLDQVDMSEWSRRLLLKTARERVAEAEAAKKRKQK